MFAKFELELETFRNDLSVWPSFNRNWHTQQGETIGLRLGNGDGDGNVVSCSNSNRTTTTTTATSLWFIMVYLDPHNQLTCARSQLTSCTSSSSSSTLWSSSTTVSISQFPAPFPWLATLCEIGPERQHEYPIPSAWVPLNGIELLKWSSELRWLAEFTKLQLRKVLNWIIVSHCIWFEMTWWILDSTCYR